MTARQASSDFRPRMNPENHASFFSGAEGYGLFKQVVDAGKLTASIEVSDGRLRVSEIVLSAEGKEPESARVVMGDDVVESKLEIKDANTHLKLSQAVTLTADQKLEIELS